MAIIVIPIAALMMAKGYKKDIGKSGYSELAALEVIRSWWHRRASCQKDLTG